MSTFRYTVDLELDFGGRTNDDKGIREGLPRILQAFKRSHIKALFFISTELLPKYRKELQEIKSQGHEIGSHGHFHIKYKESWRTEADKELSEALLTSFHLKTEGAIEYRAPKFNRGFDGHPYSFRNSHVSLLRHLWAKKEIKRQTIIYLHPFDLVKGDNPPNLFCRVWYSRPKDALATFNRLLELYPDSYIR